MNRRQMFEMIAAVTAGAGVTQVEGVSAVSEKARLSMILVEDDDILSTEEADRIGRLLEGALAGTAFHGVKVFVWSAGPIKVSKVGSQWSEQAPSEPDSSLEACAVAS